MDLHDRLADGRGAKERPEWHQEVAATQSSQIEQRIGNLFNEQHAPRSVPTHMLDHTRVLQLHRAGHTAAKSRMPTKPSFNRSFCAARERADAFTSSSSSSNDCPANRAAHETRHTLADVSI